MSNPITGFTPPVGSAQTAQNKLGTEQEQAGGGRSFSSVLEGGAQGTQATHQVSGANMEQMRVDLMQRIDRLPQSASNLTALLPEMLDNRTRMTLLKDAMNGAGGKQANMNLQGRFGQIEHEWGQIEGIMKSNKDLSTGELIGLQARMYQVSQHIEVLSKVVDQVTGGIKTVLNTNV